MGNDSQFSWVPFYKEFAGILLSYRDRRDELVEKVKAIFKRTGIHMPTLEKDNKLVDIDPFTVFGLFNKASKEANRSRILQAISDLFSVKSPIPTSYDSIPTLNPLNAAFYRFIGDRGDKDIDDLWNLFATAMAYAANPDDEHKRPLATAFDKIINQKRNGNSKVTMGLYWIAPETFLNLDSRNEWYIYESGKIPASVVSRLPKVSSKVPASDYFNIVEIIRAYLSSSQSECKDFKELSFAAWTYSQQVNEQNKKAQTDREDKGDALADEDVDVVHYWLYAPGSNASEWENFYQQGVMGLGWKSIGNYLAYETKADMQSAMKETIDPDASHKQSAFMTWQFAHTMKPGDVVFVKKGRQQLVGRGIVTSEYRYDPSACEEYPNIRSVRWTHRGEWQHPGQAAMKTLTDVTQYTDYVAQLNALFAEDVDDITEDEPERQYPPYSKEQYLQEVFMVEAQYDTLVSLLREKKNVILQGAPGVGKTYVAKRLVYAMMGEKDQERVQMIQFHQSYTYEDFIEGFRPSPNGQGFDIRKGSFYTFCKKAAEDPENEYFFIIDEINRGNLSKIFGELFMLIEADKRGNSLQLLYSDEKFYVPRNVYIIGMMNTADRSLAMLDYALRRRFAFFEMRPAFATPGFITYKQNLGNAAFDRLVACVEQLNHAIENDDSLGEGFCIGHSYFSNLSEITPQKLSGIVEYELIPLLKEYWFDEQTKVRDWTQNLRSAVQ